ncbi:MAG: Fic family protein, partial [Gemmatimonadales bacterium]
MEYVGYQRVQNQLRLAVLPVERPAVICPVTRVEPRDSILAIPRTLVPATDNPIDHLLFALKHEGTQLALLACVCRQLEPAQLLEHLRRTPNGAYIRKLCRLWEQFTGRQLEDLPAGLGGVPSPLFDPDLYLTSKAAVRDKRWRIEWNGLGTWAYCPTVRRTSYIDTWLASDFLAEVRQYLSDCSKEKLDRVLAWAYLHETRSSYAIEGEAPPSSKTEAFAALLRQAHQRTALTEEHYVELQNAAVTGALSKEPTFRHQQNYLSNGAPGAIGVT